MKFRAFIFLLAALFSTQCLAAVNPTAIYRVRISGNNLNGGGYDASISGAGTDYSQQNAAQTSGSHGTAAGTATFTDATAASFTSAMVGNAINIASGTGFTPGIYFVVGFTSSSIVTLDRSPGTGTVAVWKLGGGWADFWTNTTSSTWLVPGNTVYILGSGVPTTSSYGTPDYTMPSGITPPSGDTVNGLVSFAADPSTPGYTGTSFGGMPLISFPGLSFFSANFLKFKLLWAFMSSAASSNYGFLDVQGVVEDVVFDQNGYDIGLTNSTAIGPLSVIRTELFSSVAARSTNANPCLSSGSQVNPTFTKGSIHNCIGGGAQIMNNGGTITYSTIAKNGGVGLYINIGINTADNYTVQHNTIDGNAGNGVEFALQGNLVEATVTDNIISNHTVSGKTGMIVDTGTTSQNDRLKSIINYNTFYNNTADLSAISYGSHDVHGGSNPYVGQSTQNYATTGVGASDTVAIPQHLSGQTNTVVNNAVPGGVQPAAGGGSSGSVLVGGP